MCHTFLFTFGKVIDFQSFKYKEYSVNCAKKKFEEYIYSYCKQLHSSLSAYNIADLRQHVTETKKEYHLCFDFHCAA